MKRPFRLLLIFFILGFTGQAFSSVTVCSWNLNNFGKSKTDNTIQFIANTVKSFDVVAVQEVIAGYGGAQAVARLADALNRTGSAWDYTISDPTTTNAGGSERYAFLWKKSKVSLVGKAWLDKAYSVEINREPYMATFRYQSKEFTIVSFHAVPKAKHPEAEIKYFKNFPLIYTKLNLVFCGDFNTPQSNSCFSPLKSLGYKPAFTNQKTTIRDRCFSGDCLASSYDNFFCLMGKVIISMKNAILFFEKFPDMKSAKRVSDHIPISISFDLK